MEDDHKWKITSNGRQSQMEEKLYWKTTSTGRQESGVAHFWGSFWNSKCWSWKDSIFSYVCNFFILIVVDLTSAYVSLYQLTFPLLSNIEYGKCYDVKIWQWWNHFSLLCSGKCIQWEMFTGHRTYSATLNSSMKMKWICSLPGLRKLDLPHEQKFSKCKI